MQRQKALIDEALVPGVEVRVLPGGGRTHPARLLFTAPEQQRLRDLIDVPRFFPDPWQIDPAPTSWL